MKILLEINNQTKFKINKKLLNQVANHVLKIEGGRRLKIKKGAKLEISLALVSSGKIKKLNRIYRGKNIQTNILTFSAQNKVSSFKFQAPRFLGEIIIAPEVVKKKVTLRGVRLSSAEVQAQGETSFRNLLIRLLAHGILHLVGYNHEGRGRKFRRDERLMGIIEERVVKDFEKEKAQF